MTIEKPIQTIRKAVEGAAEKLAAQDNLKQPNEKHYSKVLSIFKKVRNISPELAEQLIITSAKGKVLTDLLGPEAVLVFEEACADAMKGLNFNIDPKNGLTDIYNNMEAIARNDPRIISMFSEKKELLDKSFDYIKEEFPVLLKHYLDNRQS